MRKGPSPLTEAELRRFKELLLEKRSQVTGDIDAVRTAGLSRSDGELSDIPQHRADRGTDESSRDLALGRFESLQELLIQIDRSLEKIEEGVYGICEESGVPIGQERLEAKPWARFSIEVEREHERQEEERRGTP